MRSNEQQAVLGFTKFTFPKETFGDMDEDTAAHLVAASSDVALVIDRDGIIRDIAVSATDMPSGGFDSVIERRWIDTVTVDSRRKVEEMLRDASTSRESAWREVNQQSAVGSFPIRFKTVDAGRDGKVIALGRDLRGDEALHQRILNAQQTMERDYLRLRQAESRYRVLFQIISEPVLIVNPGTRKIVEANPAAGNLLGVDHATLANQPLAKLFSADTRDAVVAQLIEPSGVARVEPLSVRLADGRDGFAAASSLFRQDGVVHALVSLTAVRSDTGVAEDDSRPKLLRVLNRIPDAFVVTDEALRIVEVNLAFLELAQLPGVDAAVGQPLDQFLGRPGVDMRFLVQNLREHGQVRNFGTVARTVFGDQEDVELSAVSVPTGSDVAHGFVIRSSRRVAPKPSGTFDQLPRTVEELTELVGRMSLREIVAETTDVIERMCIKAALTLTGNNRASAAEILGLSRQSLYSKLNRLGVGGADPAALA